MWVFLKFNDFIVVDIHKSQRMKCILCHNVQQEEVDQSSTQSQKGFIMYNKDHGITAMNPHVVLKHLQF
jgi:nitrate/TMAO reductase-like tetraheme cytochrome c subunit